MFGLELPSQKRAAATSVRGAMLGVDLGAYSLKSVRIAPGKPGVRLQHVRIVPYERPLTASDPEGSLDRIVAALEEARIRGSRWRPTPIACTLPLCMTQMRLIDAPEGEEAEEEGLILRELSAEETDRGEEWLGDYWPTQSGAAEDRTPLGLVGARRAWTFELIACLEARGLEPQVIDGPPFALARALRQGDFRGEEIQAALDIGYDGALFVLVKRGLPTYFRALRGCGMHGVTEALRHGLNIEESEAQQFLRACCQTTRRPSAAANTMFSTLTDMAAIPLRRLQTELVRTLEFVRRQSGGGELKRVALLGGGSLLPGVASLLENWTGLEFRPWNLRLDPLSETHGDAMGLLAQSIALADLASDR